MKFAKEVCFVSFTSKNISNQISFSAFSSSSATHQKLIFLEENKVTFRIANVHFVGKVCNLKKILLKNENVIWKVFAEIVRVNYPAI